MAKYTINLAATTTGAKVCNVKKKRDMPLFYYTIMGYGAFGGGTLAWFVSPDNGTTLIPMTDLTDTAVSMTTNKMYDGSLCASSHNTDTLSIWVTLSVATSPSLTASVYDNNG